jgi:pyruvate/2-oxoglutarate/acetoin dehydrogenase E1 component
MESAANPVVPAKAGTPGFRIAKPSGPDDVPAALDSRFRGNDRVAHFNRNTL